MYGTKTKGVIRWTVWIGLDGTVHKHGRGWPMPPSTRRRCSSKSTAPGLSGCSELRVTA
jgi:hypothetical protein